ncbi:MAG: Guanine nucleotide exchange factor lte1 [Chaenotheca gracillima]|nr:MAG: Guanine nucleotide exchange factor lte1 [Chaenotheca gracillima]
MEESWDVVIVGAGMASLRWLVDTELTSFDFEGPSGLCAAKTYLECAPDTKLTIIDANETLGGVWAKERLYPDLKTNNLLGTLEFSDFPMHEEEFGVKLKQHIPGEALHHYFYSYAKAFDLLRRITFRTKVVEAEWIASRGRWVLDARLRQSSDAPPDDKQPARKLSCKKLIVATGVTSKPKEIRFPGEETFTCPRLAFGNVGLDAPALLKDPDINRVAVYGANKAGHDCAALFSSAGKQVEWIVRASGRGGGWMSPAYVRVGPMLCWFEKLTTIRALTWFSPCIWGDADGFGWIRGLMHGTRPGRWIVDKFWNAIHQTLKDMNGYDRSEDMKKLEPQVGPLWSGTSTGILNYDPPLYDRVISGQIKVHCKDMTSLSGKTIHFTDGTSLSVDALITAPGWDCKPTIKLTGAGSDAELGLPSFNYTRSELEGWVDLERKADVEIFKRFPGLLRSPACKASSSNLQENPLVQRAEGPNEGAGEAQDIMPPAPRYRLYRGIAPPNHVTSSNSHDHSVVFLSTVSNISRPHLMELQALWSYAYLTNNTPANFPFSASSSSDPALSDGDRGHAIHYSTALFNRFGHWRYPYGHGSQFPDFVFDGVPYFDLLLRDLGMSERRKRGGWALGRWFRELFEPYGVEEYKGVVKEWLALQERGAVGNGTVQR